MAPGSPLLFGVRSRVVQLDRMDCCRLQRASCCGIHICAAQGSGWALSPSDRCKRHPVAIRKSICRRFDARPSDHPFQQSIRIAQTASRPCRAVVLQPHLDREIAASTETSKCGSRCPHICQQAMASSGREVTRLRGAPLVAMVQAADLRNGDHGSSVRQSDWT